MALAIDTKDASSPQVFMTTIHSTGPKSKASNTVWPEFSAHFERFLTAGGQSTMTSTSVPQGIFLTICG